MLLTSEDGSHTVEYNHDSVIVATIMPGTIYLEDRGLSALWSLSIQNPDGGQTALVAGLTEQNLAEERQFLLDRLTGSNGNIDYQIERSAFSGHSLGMEVGQTIEKWFYKKGYTLQEPPMPYVRFR